MLPREKLSQWGIASLSTSELIAIILSTGCRNKTVFHLSKEVEKILKKGNLNIEELKKLRGIGEVKAMKLLCSIEVGYRLSCRKNEVERIVSSEKAVKHFKNILNKKQEYFQAIFLNARFEIVGKKTISIGTFDRTQVFSRDIIIPALEVNGAYVILGHNHPSGSPIPSREDIQVTQRIKRALSLVGITLLDHLVVTEKEWRNVDLK